MLCDQGDIDTLSNNILHLLEDKELYDSLAISAYKYAVKRWGNKQALDSIIFAYKSILNITK